MEHLERTALRQQNQENRKIRAPHAALPPSTCAHNACAPRTNSSCSNSPTPRAPLLFASFQQPQRQKPQVTFCLLLLVPVLQCGVEAALQPASLCSYFYKRALQSPRIQCRGQEEGGARSFGIWTPGLFLTLLVAQAKHESNKKGRELGRKPHPGELRTHHPMRHRAPSLRVLAQGPHTPARARASQTRPILVGRGVDQERL